MHRNSLKSIHFLVYLFVSQFLYIAQSAGAVEYTDYTPAEG